MTSHVDDFWSQEQLQEKDAQLRKLEAKLLAFEEKDRYHWDLFVNRF